MNALNASNNILELQNIHKRFGGVIALDGASLVLKKGEIHVLVGENGAGKSTMIKIMTGVHLPDSGQLVLDGEEISFQGPKDALADGIIAIYQHATVYPQLSVTENMFMGHEEISGKTKRILWKNMHLKAQTILDNLGAKFKSTDIVSDLSVAQQQMVEIAKALSIEAKVIIMDEPTSSLTKKESEELYRISKNIRDNGGTVLFVSHRLEDIYRLADRVTVFRDAKYIDTWDIKNITEEELIFAMVGRKIDRLYDKDKKKVSEIGEVALRVENFSRVGWFEDVSFEVKYGEILSITGLVGAGRTEVFQSVLGIEEHSKGNVYINGEGVKINHPKEAFMLGIGYLPEDRQLQGAILDWDLMKNVSISSLEKISKYSFIKNELEVDFAKKILEKIGVKASSIYDSVNSLSGGNQQKVVISKLLGINPKILIMDEPTKGVDIGAKSAIYQIMHELTASGCAIIMISSEMPEVLGVSDRVVVMREGRISKEFINNSDLTQEMLLIAAMNE